VPEDKFAWKPQQKSSSLGKLASHLAAIPGWAAVVVNGHGKKSPDASSNAELLEVLDRNIAAGRDALAGANDDYLGQIVLPAALSFRFGLGAACGLMFQPSSLTQALLEAALDLKRRNGLAAENVEHLRCDVFLGAYEFAGGGSYGSKDHPQIKEQGDYNLKYLVSAVRSFAR
jgi:hypothetical protein